MRGRQSAALLVVPAEGEPWQWTIDLRVEDHPDPIAELDRLLALLRPYGLAEGSTTLTGEGRPRGGRRDSTRCPARPAPDELLFWAGLAPAQPATCEGVPGVAARTHPPGLEGAAGAPSRSSRPPAAKCALRCAIAG